MALAMSILTSTSCGLKQLIYSYGTSKPAASHGSRDSDTKKMLLRFWRSAKKKMHHLRGISLDKSTENTADPVQRTKNRVERLKKF